MGSDVDTVIIDGKIVMEKRKILTVNEEEALENADEVGRKFVRNRYAFNIRG